MLQSARCRRGRAGGAGARFARILDGPSAHCCWGWVWLASQRDERAETYGVVSSRRAEPSRGDFPSLPQGSALVPEIFEGCSQWGDQRGHRGRMRHSLSCGDGRAARGACFVRFALDGIYGDGSQDVAGRYESRRSARSLRLGAVIAKRTLHESSAVSKAHSCGACEGEIRRATCDG